jgi:hypothetical protein
VLCYAVTTGGQQLNGIGLSDVVFDRCASNSQGGAIFIADSSMNMAGGGFFGCSAADGGAVYMTSSVPQPWTYFIGVTFSANGLAGPVADPSVGMAIRGGAVSVHGQQRIDFMHCTMAGNNAYLGYSLYA